MGVYCFKRQIGRLSSLLLVCGLCIGCSSQPSRIYQAAVDIDEACKLAFAQYDLDNDGAISKDERAAFPAVGRHFSLFDQDSDGKVSTEEFKQRLATIFDSRVALMTGTCNVTRKGKPLAGAVVRFVPEEFLAGDIPPAEGVVNANGNATLSIKTEDLPEGAPNVEGFIRPGLYRVVITHPSRKIPAKYNRETILGEEVSKKTATKGPFRFAL